MKRLITKYWIFNVLFCISLFFIYRFLIAEKDYPDEDWLDFLLNILEIFTNLGFSLIFIIVLPVCALTFFLNLIGKIRNNFYLSLLTFIGIPTGVVIYVLIAFIDLASSGSHIFLTALVFSIVYLIFNCTQFQLFRRKVIIKDDVIID